MKHTAYGLVIRSDVALPELAFAPDDAEADVEIRLTGQLDKDLTGFASPSEGIHAQPGCLLLHVPDVAWIRVEEGQRIWVEPAAGIDLDSVRLFVLGSGLGALLMQRGFLVIHGNAIVAGDGCIVGVGPSGIGKSTMAAGFVLRGFNVLADDVVPIDAQGLAWPGFPRIKLWDDAARHLAVQTDGLQRIRPGMAKFNVPIQRQLEHPVPVRWMFELSVHDAPEVLVNDVKGMAKLPLIQRNSYRAHYLEPLGLAAEHFRLCAGLAARIRVSQVIRPSQGFELARLMDALLAQLAEPSAADVPGALPVSPAALLAH